MGKKPAFTSITTGIMIHEIDAKGIFLEHNSMLSNLDEDNMDDDIIEPQWKEKHHN